MTTLNSIEKLRQFPTWFKFNIYIYNSVAVITAQIVKFVNSTN